VHHLTVLPLTPAAFAYDVADCSPWHGQLQRIDETGAGQWGTALSLACSMFDLECTVYMVKAS